MVDFFIPKTISHVFNSFLSFAYTLTRLHAYTLTRLHAYTLTRLHAYTLLILLLLPLSVYAQYYGDPIYYYKADVQTHTSVTRPPASNDYRSTTIVIEYENVSGNDPWPAEAIMAFDEAARMWEEVIVTDVVITISASYISIDGDGGTAGVASTGFTQKELLVNVNGVVPDTDYPNALANKLAGFDLLPNNTDGSVTLDKDEQDWYFGLDGNPPPGQTDFVSVALHEIGHVMGFSTRGTVVDDDTGIGTIGSAGTGFSTITIWDRFICDENGDFITDMIEQGDIQNPSVELGQLLTSDNIYWCGPNGIAGNDGNAVGIYAPPNWTPGGSYIHISQDFASATNGNNLMTPAYSGPYTIGPMIIGMLEDMGWMVNPITSEDYAWIDQCCVENTDPNHPTGYDERTIIYEGEPIWVVGAIDDHYPYNDYFTIPEEMRIEAYSNNGAHTLLSHTSHYLIGWDLPDLPGGNYWLRNPDGTVRAKISYLVGDTGYGPVLRADRLMGIGKAPDAPFISLDVACQRATLSFYSRGAGGYYVYYDTDSGEPYEGTGLPQGDSPIWVDGSINSLTFTRLEPDQTYYFNAKAGQTGEMGNEVSVYISCDSCNNVVVPADACVEDTYLIVDYSDVRRSSDTVELGIVKTDIGAVDQVYYEGSSAQDQIDFKNVSASEFSVLSGSEFVITEGDYIIALKYKLCGEWKDLTRQIEVEPSPVCGSGGWNRLVFSSHSSGPAAPDLFHLQPNPARDAVIVNVDEKHFSKSNDVHLTIYDLRGRRVVKQKLQQGREEISLTSLSGGTYIVKLENGIADFEAQKLVVIK